MFIASVGQGQGPAGWVLQGWDGGDPVECFTPTLNLWLVGCMESLLSLVVSLDFLRCK